MRVHKTDHRPHLLLVPAEIRQHIYTYLFDDGGSRWIKIQNKPAARRSTKYHVAERTSMFHQRFYETTYQLGDAAIELHPAIMSVCRQLYLEASYALYGRHDFEFGQDVQAVVPFLADRVPLTLPLVMGIGVYKRGPRSGLGCTSEKNEWSFMCRYLLSSSTLKRLRVVVETGRPSQPWDGVQELSAADIRLLSLIGHESLEWVRELAQVKMLEEVEVVPDEKYLPVPESSAMAVYAALSASVNDGLVQFLKSEMERCSITASA
ncbi:hypothetical protein BD289DRAFT_373627 [Coniella lustricola]|uniref:DUF7730 domain-containing protein n=1 Tax=Coniella lustricola TaxID=2025994 RepID=A0A2T3A0S1_9PEZI|nr:hypothetical protein BD289DRAFT_373627 [Coniella lustricola]